MTNYRRNKILKVVEEFHGELYHSDVQPQSAERTEITETPAVQKDEVKSLTEMQEKWRSYCGEMGLVSSHYGCRRDRRRKLLKLLTEFFKEGRVPESWTNAAIVSVHKERRFQRPQQLCCQLFTDSF